MHVIGNVFSCAILDHSFSKYAKFSENLIFPSPRYAHVRVCIKGLKNVSFSENFAFVLIE